VLIEIFNPLLDMKKNPFLTIVILVILFVGTFFLLTMRSVEPDTMKIQRVMCEVDTCTYDGFDVTVSFTFQYVSLRKGIKSSMAEKIVGKLVKNVTANITMEDLINDRFAFREVVIEELRDQEDIEIPMLVFTGVTFYESPVNFNRGTLYTKDLATIDFTYVTNLRRHRGQEAAYGSRLVEMAKNRIVLEIRMAAVEYMYTDFLNNKAEIEKEIGKKVLENVQGEFWEDVVISTLNISFTPPNL